MSIVGRPKVGDKVRILMNCVNEMEEGAGKMGKNGRERGHAPVTATIVEVNRAHRWFRVEYTEVQKSLFGVRRKVTFTECFKFIPPQLALTEAPVMERKPKNKC